MKGILAAVIALLGSSSYAQTDSPLPANAAAAIARALPGAAIIRARDVDADSCGRTPANPGLVIGDLKGNKRKDFAVLMKIGGNGKSIDWNGKRFTNADFAFAIFVEDGDASFTEAYVRRFSDLIPIGAYLDLTPPGRVSGVGTNPSVSLKNAGVSFVWCEKSEAVYYFSGDRVREHWVSD